MKAIGTAFLLCLALAVPGCGDDGSPGADAQSPAEAAKRPKPKPKAAQSPPPSDLVVEDEIEGDGTAAAKGDQLAVRFVAVNYVSGKHFETIWEKPFEFELGPDEVSPGWVRGLEGMRAGGRRRLIVPPNLSSRFGTPAGSGPEDTLLYVIDLLEVR